MQSDTVIRTTQDIEELLHHFTLLGCGGTDFRPAFAYVDELLAKGAFHRLKGLLYFTDGKGIYPTKPPPYDTAFLFLEPNDNGPGTDGPVYPVPAWAMRVNLYEEDFPS